MQRAITDASYERVPRSELVEAVDRVAGVERARAKADEYAQAARDALNELPQSDYLDSLQAIPAYVLDRDR